MHLLPTADLPMWTGALCALPSSAPMHPEPVRFTPDQADEVIAAMGDALAEGELTVDELTEAIAERAGAWAVERTMEAFGDKWPRWRQLTSTAAHRGVLCFGANRGNKVTYTNPHRWLPGFRPDDGERALRALVTRYLYAYGPATPAHFARWLSIPPRSALELFRDLADELEPVELEGEPAWTLAGDTAAPAAPHRGLCLLPYFDAFVVAGQPRERLFPGPARDRGLTPGGQAGNYPVLLVNGVVGGVWHQRRSGRAARDHGRAVAPAHRRPTPAARRRGRTGGRGDAGEADAYRRHRDRRPARVSPCHSGWMSDVPAVAQLRVVVEVEDYDAAVAFLRDALGLTQEAAFSGGGDERVSIFDAGRATVELANPAHRRYIDEVEVGRQVAPRFRLAFEVDDARAATRRLVDAGAVEVAPPTRTPWDSLNPASTRRATCTSPSSRSWPSRSSRPGRAGPS